MKKFIVHTRPLAGYCKLGDVPIVIEVEGETITAVEDPSVMWLPVGEFRFRVLKPEILYEPQEDGTKTPPVYFSHSVYRTLDQAQSVAERLVRGQFQFALRKYGTAFTEEQVKEKCEEIQEILLP
jgi:hypothetical protein